MDFPHTIYHVIIAGSFLGLKVHVVFKKKLLGSISTGLSHHILPFFSVAFIHSFIYSVCVHMLCHTVEVRGQPVGLVPFFHRVGNSGHQACEQSPLPGQPSQ